MTEEVHGARKRVARKTERLILLPVAGVRTAESYTADPSYGDTLNVDKGGATYHPGYARGGDYPVTTVPWHRVDRIVRTPVTVELIYDADDGTWSAAPGSTRGWGDES